MKARNVLLMLAMFAVSVKADILNDTVTQFFTLVLNIVTGIAGVGEMIGQILGYSVVFGILLTLIGVLFAILSKFGLKIKMR